MSNDDLDPESVIKDNPEVIHEQIIPSALETMCKECGQPGATAVVKSAAGSGKPIFHLHLLCAKERGNIYAMECVKGPPLPERFGFARMSSMKMHKRM